MGIRTLSGILEQVAFDGAVVLSHKGGVLTSGCHAQEFLQQELRAITQEAFPEGDTVGFSGS